MILGGAELQPSMHAIVLVGSAVGGATLVATTLRYREERVAIPIGFMFAVAAAWSIGDAMKLLLGPTGAMVPWFTLRVLVALPIGPFVLWVVLEYLDREDLVTPRTLAALLVVPITSALLVLGGTDTGLVVASVEPVVLHDPLFGTTYTTLDPTFGVVFLVNTLYNHVLIVAAVVLLVRSLRGDVDASVYRGQTATLLFAIAVPLAVNVLVRVGALHVDLTAASFFVAVALVSAAVFRYELFTLLPIARDTAVDEVDEGFFVLDRDDRIVDCNPAATRMLRRDPADVVDRPATEVLPRFDEIASEHEPAEEVATEIEVATDDDSEYYDVTASPIYGSGELVVGHVLLVEDVTDRVERKKRLQDRTAELAARTRDLERQNERLEEFASVLSHDLRNPLGVASAYLERARETDDADDFDAVAESLERIDRLVDDLLTMARQGQTVDDPEPLALRNLAESAWSHVDTTGAELVVDTDAVVVGDESRLLQAVENLFRNAVEHATEGADGAVASGAGPRSTPDAGSQSTSDARGQSGSDPGGQSGSDLGRQSGSDLGGQSGSDPGGQSGAAPGEQFGAEPRSDADDPAGAAVHDGGAGATVDRQAGGQVDESPPELTVRVGDLPDGFFVADDGPGIPPEEREQVFERGYSRAADGTGLGLSIVEMAVEAHGWTVSVTESDSGGARFEVRGVDRSESGESSGSPRQSGRSEPEDPGRDGPDERT